VKMCGMRWVDQCTGTKDEIVSQSEKTMPTPWGNVGECADGPETVRISGNSDLTTEVKYGCGTLRELIEKPNARAAWTQSEGALVQITHFPR